MSTWQIACKFFRNDWRRYVAFLTSTAFTVMVYFLYTALSKHPDLQGGYAYSGFAVQGMRAAAVVIVIFSFLFLLYSSSSFVRLRTKELGLLSLLGVSKRQLAQVILGEHLLIAGVSIAAGLGVGFLLLKLFFMGISAVMQLPRQLSFSARADVWLHTIGVFGAMFIVVAISSTYMVLRRSVVELVRSVRKPKATPRFSFLRLALGLLLTIGGYRWASSPDPFTVVAGVVPVTLMVSVGTVFLMREASIALLNWIHGTDRLYYRTGPFLTVSQLAYKIQDNYRVLAAVAILVAVILSAVGTIFTLYALTMEDALASHPNPIQLAQYGVASEQPGIEAVERALERHGVGSMMHRSVVGLRGRLIDKKTDIVVLPYSFYLEQRRSKGSYALADIDEDRKYAYRLKQIGVTDRELRGQALWQMAVIFFLPFVVGLVHSTMAMNALGTLTGRTVLHFGWTGALLFLVLFAGSFIGSGRLYWTSLREGLR
ncbi:MAG: ABC transporter permease [Bacillota bacterium]